MEITFEDVLLFGWFSKQIICLGVSSLSPCLLLQENLANAAGKGMKLQNSKIIIKSLSRYKAAQHLSLRVIKTFTGS